MQVTSMLTPYELWLKPGLPVVAGSLLRLCACGRGQKIPTKTSQSPRRHTASDGSPRKRTYTSTGAAALCPAADFRLEISD